LQNNENYIHFLPMNNTINIDFYKFVQPSKEKKPFMVVFYSRIRASGCDHPLKSVDKNVQSTQLFSFTIFSLIANGRWQQDTVC